MGDGGIQYLLLLIFIFWVLESIAKARKRGQLPEETYEEEDEEGVAHPPAPGPTRERLPRGERVPFPGEGQPERRPQMERQPRPASTRAEPAPTPRPAPADGPPGTLWEQIAAEIERARREAEGPEPAGRAPAPTAPPVPTPPVPAERQASTRWDKGTEREAVLRTGRPVGEERRSDRWMAGKEPEVLAKPGGAPAAAAGRPAARSLVLQRPERAGLRDWRLAVEKAKAVAPVTARDVRDLTRASPAELRRIIVLKEVLGPPVALREEGLGTPPVG